MTITGFDCLKMTAILMFEIDTSPTGGVSAVLMGDGVFQMEPDAEPNLTLFYVELLVKVEVNFVKGYLAADAALAPTSYVYLPQHLPFMSSSSYFADPWCRVDMCGCQRHT